MSRRWIRSAVVVAGVVIALVAGAYVARHRPAVLPADFVVVDRAPTIFPDYADCVIPPNIAPLNFVVTEEGTDYRVRIHSQQGDAIVLASRTGRIIIPMRAWKELLGLNRGGRLGFDVYVRRPDGQWERFETIANTVAEENIDPYVVYRMLGPLHRVFVEMGIYQRNIETYDESPVLVSPPGARRCVNCHTFVNNQPDTLILHVRGTEGPVMLLGRNGQVESIDTRTPFNASPAAYTSWHPSGALAAFSANKLTLWLRTAGQTRSVIDYDSDLGVYMVESNSVRSAGGISDPDYLETFPTWSPDGRYLYFCRAKRTWPIRATDSSGEYRHYFDISRVPPDYEQLQYDLARISYDVQTDQWGELETVLQAGQIDRSISEPRVSPDGRFLLFAAASFGTFPIYMDDSDLYMLDLSDQPPSGQPRRHWRLAANSDRGDSWPCWSSNGRWIVFSSKRHDGLLARPYFSYVDQQGRSHKPVLLPQEDPEFYDGLLKTYNLPELVTGPVPFTQRQLIQAAGPDQEVRNTTPVSGATPPARSDPPPSP